MSDDLEKLGAALRAAPEPDPAAKAAALARAMAEFDRVRAAAQGSAERPRLMSDRPARAGVLTGVLIMLSRLTARPMLAGSASAVAIAVALLVAVPAWREAQQIAALPKPEVPADGPVAGTVPVEGRETGEAGNRSGADEELRARTEVGAVTAPRPDDAPVVSDQVAALPPVDPAEPTMDDPDAEVGVAGAKVSDANRAAEATDEADPPLAEQEFALLPDDKEATVATTEAVPETPATSETAAIAPEEQPSPDLSGGIAGQMGAEPAPQPLQNPVVAGSIDGSVTPMRRQTGAGVGLAALGGESDGSVAAAPEAASIAAGVVSEASDYRYASPVAPAANTEAFANEAPSPIKVTAAEPVSTFSTDVDTAAFGVVRSSLMAGMLPPRDAIRIEEMVNYFPYDYPQPAADGAPFRPTVTVTATPWNPDTRLVHIAIQGQKPTIDDRPPLNLVFLIDTSGSMDEPNKLPLLVQSFRLMVGQLRPEDRVAIVTYAGSAGLVLEPTEARERSTILAALDRLHAGGSTAGAEGLQQAYQVAEQMAEAREGEEVSRIILATDGDFNLGISDPEALKEFIAGKRKTGTYLSVLGYGRGNLDDAVMQALAQNGNGTAGYIDTLGEAQKVLVDQLSGALFPIADDVKVQIEFNPAVIAEYRLVGYETRALRREDFNNDRVDAGDIGVGLTVTAIYEVTPVGSPALRADPLRYSAAADAATEPAATTELGFLKLRYKEPGATSSQLIALPIAPEVGAAGTEARWAIAVAGFGQLLQGGEYLGDWGWDQAIALAAGARGEDAFGYRAEAVQLMRLAQSLAN